MNFEQFNLDPRLMQGINYAGYHTATPIQEAAIPAALRGRELPREAGVESAVCPDRVARCGGERRVAPRGPAQGSIRITHQR